MQTERQREAKELRAQGAEVGQRIRARADRERRVLIAEAEREAAIARGQGDAEAIRIFAEAYGQDPDFFDFYRSLQAYRESLGDGATSFVLSPKSEFFRFFNGRAVGPEKPSTGPSADLAAGASAPPTPDPDPDPVRQWRGGGSWYGRSWDGLGAGLCRRGRSWALFPETMKQAAARAIMLDAGRLRLGGLAFAIVGVLLVWLIRR